MTRRCLRRIIGTSFGGPFCALVCVCLFIASTAGAAFASGTIFDVRLVRVIDGDSLEVSINGRKETVRLCGIDTPEYKQEFGKEARNYTARFCRGKKLRLEFDKDKRDKHRRLLAYVWHGAEFLNRQLVENGLALAVYYKPNGKYYKTFKAIEKKAKKERIGFWKQGD